MQRIGILGGDTRSAVVDIILNQIQKSGYTATTCSSIYEYNGLDDKMPYAACDCDYLLASISNRELISNTHGSVRFDMLVQTDMEEADSNAMMAQAMQEAVYSIKENGYFIFNPDTMQKTNLHCDRVYPVTYGLNGRTTVTTSSIDDTDKLNFNFCIQRSIIDVKGSLIQPFEMPVLTDGNYSDIHSYLAAMTSLLILGFKL